MSTTTGADRAGTLKSDLEYIAHRMQMILTLIESVPDSDDERRAVLWIACEDFLKMATRVWRHGK